MPIWCAGCADGRQLSSKTPSRLRHTGPDHCRAGPGLRHNRRKSGLGAGLVAVFGCAYFVRLSFFASCSFII